MHPKRWEFNFETYAMKENSFKTNYQIVSAVTVVFIMKLSILHVHRS